MQSNSTQQPASPAQPVADTKPACGLLPHLGVIRFAGPDAASFLQGQISNDTRRLASGSTLLAAYSSPQGRVVALLHLLPHSTGILALLPREIVLPTLERLRKFVLRAKVQIEDVSGQFSVAGYHGADALRAAGLDPPDADPAVPGRYAEHAGIGVARVAGAGTLGETGVGDAGGGGSERYWAVGRNADLEARGGAGFGADSERYRIIGSTADPAARGFAVNSTDSERIDNDWRLADIRAGLPQVYAATREMFVAQMLNLDLIDGISFTKGCFTGQEIIARTQHLGRIKRRLFRLRLPAGTWAIGQAIHLRDGRSGRLIELAHGSTGVEALAVLTLGPGAPADADADSDAGTLLHAVELPLPYPLTRKA